MTGFGCEHQAIHCQRLNIYDEKSDPAKSWFMYRFGNALLISVMLILCLLCSESHTWLGYWGAHMKTEEFRALKEYQKVLFLLYFTNLTLDCKYCPEM